jgi:outer membrane protein TolC
MKLGTSHRLSTALHDLDLAVASAQSHLDRATAAKAEVKSVTALYMNGRTTLDELLDAQRRLAQSMEDYHAAIAGQAIAIKDINFQRGPLLQQRGVKLED